MTEVIGIGYSDSMTTHEPAAPIQAEDSSTPVQVIDAEPRVTIELPLTEALAVGHSLRALAKTRAFPGSDTARIYRSVGDAMVTASYNVMVKR